MVGASKILTVSYGTFSCTLEGFDDPFNTMRAIAEYFRDLAADDRYFGAEPPTPDAAMLHRIAEREVQRRVEAKVQDNGVILRAGDRMSPMVTPEMATAPAGSVEETVAAKLLRIRAAVARGAAPASTAFAEDQDAAPAPVWRAPATAAPTEAEVVAAPVVAEVPAPPPAAEPPALPVAATPVAEASAVPPPAPEVIVMAPPAAPPAPELVVVAELAPAAAMVPEIVAAAPPTAEVAAALAPQQGDTFALAPDNGPADIDTVAAAVVQDDVAVADLSALTDEPAPVPASEAGAAAQPEATQPEIPEAIVPVDETALMAALADTLAGEGAFTPDTVVMTPAAPAPEAAGPDTEALMAALAETLAGAFVAPETADPAPLPETAPEPEAPAQIAPDTDTLIAALTGNTTADVPVAAIAPAVDDVTDAMPEVARPTLRELDADAALLAALDDSVPLSFAATQVEPALPEPATPLLPATLEEAPALTDKLRRARARVIKVRRPDAAEAAPAEPAAAAPATTLSPEAEAALLRDLEAVEREMPAPPRAEGDARSLLESTTGDEAVGRILRQTNSEMDVPENRRRLSTIAHLKAAVAATVADLKSPTSGSESREPSRLDRYRADLARVVRPRRPATSGAQGDRPAPLVLVSEQRIDRPAPAPAPEAAPKVMPRRVSSAGNLAIDNSAEEPEPTNIFAAATSFADFAERLGASDLPDLLEAAAAYTACIEGRPHFTRPQLMKHVTAVAEDTEASREDGLRSFGALLRSGKIAKVKRGQFAITDASHILAEARRIAR